MRSTIPWILSLAAAAVAAQPAAKPSPKSAPKQPAPAAKAGGKSVPPGKTPAPKAPAGDAAAKPSADKSAPAKPPAPPAKPMAFEPAELGIAPGETVPAVLFVPSPTGKKVQGELTYATEGGVSVLADSRWPGDVPSYGRKTFPKIKAAADFEGEAVVRARFADQIEAPLKVTVTRPGVEIVPGRVEGEGYRLTVKITNPFKGRALVGRVQASNKDRFLQDITTREFRIGAGETGEVVFPLPGAAPAAGEKYDFPITVETYHGYKDQKTHSLEFPELAP